MGARKQADLERRTRRQEARAKITHLRENLRRAVAAKKQRMRELASAIRTERLALRDRLRENRRRFLEELRSWETTQRAGAREAWAKQRQDAKAGARGEIERVRAELAAERLRQREERRIAREARVRAANHATSAAKQSDDQVRALIPPRLVPLFERWRASIKAGPAQSRAEAFLAAAASRPDEVFTLLEPRLARAIAETLSEIVRAKREAKGGVVIPLPTARRPAPANSNSAPAPGESALKEGEHARLAGIERRYQDKKRTVKAPELKEPKEIAKRIRADIQAAVKAGKLPKAKYSVTSEQYTTGGASIDVVASKLPFAVLNPDAFVVDPGANYMRMRGRAEERFTARAKDVDAKLRAIVDAYHWDRSDLVTDYRHSRFIPDIKISEGDERGRIERALVQAAKAEKGRV